MSLNTPESELRKLLTIRFGQLMIRSESYPTVGELVDAAMPIIDQHTQAKVVETKVDTMLDLVWHHSIADHAEQAVIDEANRLKSQTKSGEEDHD